MKHLGLGGLVVGYAGLVRMADTVDQHTHGFFGSPGGVVLLGISVATGSAIVLLMGRKIPQLFRRIDGIVNALMGEPAQPEYGIPERKGLIRQVEELTRRQDEEETNLTDALEVARKEMKNEIAAVRRMLRNAGIQDTNRH